MFKDDQEASRYRELMNVRAQTDNPFKQLILAFGELREQTLIQDDPGGHPVAFTPRSLDDPRFGGVKDSTSGIDTLNAGQATHSYTLPQTGDSDLPILVSVGAGSKPDEHIEVSGGQLNVSYTWDLEPIGDPDEANYRTTWTIRVNGITVESGAYSGAPGFVFLRYPVVLSTIPGLYTVNQEGDAIINRTVTYVQRSLEFRDPFPEYDPTSDEPVEIVNKIQWNDEADVEGAAWKILEEDEEALLLAEKRGTGVDIQATWEPQERVLSRTEPSPDGEDRYERVPFVVTASADSYTIAGTKIPYEISTDFEVHGEVKLKIINEDVDPPNPFEDENSDDPTVTANVAIFDPEILESDVNWRVSLENPEGFEVADLATGTGCDISASWDGFVDGIEVPNPTEYVFVLRANACGEEEPPVGTARQIRGQIVVPPDGGSCPKEAKPKRVAMGGLPKLEIIQLITIGTSLDDPNDLDSSGVLRLGRVNDLNSWTIRLSNLEFDTVPSKLNVDIIASGTQDSVELSDLSGGNGSIYEGSISSSDPILATEPDAQYSFHDINGIQDDTLSPNLDSIETFDQLYRSLSLFLSSSRYPYASNLRRLGLLEYLTSAESINEKRSIAPGSAFANKPNFAKLSFEDVDFSFHDPRATNLSDPLKATVKTKNKAGLIYAVVHGGQDGALQLSEFRSSGIWSNVNFFPGEINASDIVGLKTLILASCGALNVHDYNNQMTSPQTPLAN